MALIEHRIVERKCSDCGTNGVRYSIEQVYFNDDGTPDFAIPVDLSSPSTSDLISDSVSIRDAIFKPTIHESELVAMKNTAVDGGAWIATFTGKQFHLFHPKESEICIEDIAHALANQCRYTGHSRFFMSVAQHSVHVSRLCSPEWALHGLLHDASEAYLQDMARPLKRSPEMAVYRSAESVVQRAVWRKFGLTTEDPVDVHHADRAMLWREANALMGPLHPAWNVWEPFSEMFPEGAEGELIPTWTPGRAEKEFLERYRELKHE